jgi:hypothetical protein
MWRFSMIVLCLSSRWLLAQDCQGEAKTLVYAKNLKQEAYLLSDGALVTRYKAAVNADGMKKAYHQDGIAGGGLISLCNGGRPYPAGRAAYNASGTNGACSQFAKDYRAIKAAGWKDASVGAIHWFGVLARDTLVVGRETVTLVAPVLQGDGSGYYVSPTALEDARGFPDPGDQRRYIDAESIPAAVMRNSAALKNLGIKLGTFGVAMHKTHRKPVPFIVGDYGPRIGEGTFALSRLLSGKSLVPATRKNINSGDVQEKDVLWVFFGGERMSAPFLSDSVIAQAKRHFEAWGGAKRLEACMDNTAIPVAQ